MVQRPLPIAVRLTYRIVEHMGLWAASGTYGAFTPLFYLPVRIFSQQNQDSPFDLGVCFVSKPALRVLIRIAGGHYCCWSFRS